MNTSKINLRAVSVTMVSAGSILMYFESYRNKNFIFTVCYVLIFLGWFILFMQLTKGTIIDAKRVPFNQNRRKSLQQGTVKLFANIILVAIIGCNMFYISQLANNRENEILQNGLTRNTIAEIIDIETSYNRSGTHYHAIFLYKTADGQSISYSWSEKANDFITGQKYEIKYAVEYPEMFSILRQVK